MPHHTLEQLSNRLGPIIYVRLGQVPTVVISSAKLAGKVLKVHDDVFCNRPQLISAQYLSFGCSDVTFSRYGPYWRQARKICVTELLSPRRVNSFKFVRNEEVFCLRKNSVVLIEMIKSCLNSIQFTKLYTKTLLKVKTVLQIVQDKKTYFPKNIEHCSVLNYYYLELV